MLVLRALSEAVTSQGAVMGPPTLDESSKVVTGHLTSQSVLLELALARLVAKQIVVGLHGCQVA